MSRMGARAASIRQRLGLSLCMRVTTSPSPHPLPVVVRFHMLLRSYLSAENLMIAALFRSLFPRTRSFYQRPDKFQSLPLFCSN